MNFSGEMNIKGVLPSDKWPSVLGVSLSSLPFYVMSEHKTIHAPALIRCFCCYIMSANSKDLANFFSFVFKTLILKIIPGNRT